MKLFSISRSDILKKLKYIIPFCHSLLVILSRFMSVMSQMMPDVSILIPISNNCPILYTVCVHAYVFLHLESDDVHSRVFGVTPDFGFLRSKKPQVTGCSQCLQISFSPR